MGHQGEVLEYHCDVFVAIAPEGIAGQGQNVLAADPDVPGRRFQQPIDMPDQG